MTVPDCAHGEALTIVYRLIGPGWAECTIAAGPQHATLTASYLTDALGSLAAAVRVIAAGGYEAAASFTEEPGEHTWAFTRRPGGRVHVTISWYDDWPTVSRKASATPALVLFDAEVGVGVLLLAMVACLADVMQRYGLAGYLGQWINDPFPLDEYERLIALVRSHPE